jgi:predicted GIY-YIG superfamily endonuclease
VITVYRISCCSGATYIGSTVQAVGHRFSEHRSTLRAGRHRNPSLQRLWDLHGEGAFTFAALATCAEPVRKAIEQSWVDATPGAVNVYSPVARSEAQRRADRVDARVAALLGNRGWP